MYEEKDRDKKILKDMEAVLGVLGIEDSPEPIEIPIREYYKIGKILQEKTDDGLFEYMKEYDLTEIDKIYDYVSSPREELNELYRNKKINELFRTLMKHLDGPSISKGEKLPGNEEKLCIYKTGVKIPEKYRNYIEEIKDVVNGYYHCKNK